MKHNPLALMRAMAKGLDTCSQDSSAPFLAISLRKLSEVSHEISDEADAIDAARLEAALMPALMKASPEIREKFLNDCMTFAAVMYKLGEHTSQAIIRYNAQSN